MKRILAVALALTLALASPALAENTLNGSIAIDGDTLYYSGSVDGNTQATYKMGLDGSNPKVIYERDMSIGAAVNSCLIGLDYGETAASQMIVLPDGSTVPLKETNYGGAIVDGDRVYLGAFSVNYDGTDYRDLVGATENREYYFESAAVDGGYYYYHDLTQYASDVFYEGGDVPCGAQLKRVNLETGAIEDVSGAGSVYLGADDTYVYYFRENFAVWDSAAGTSKDIDTNPGLFRADKATLTEMRLADAPSDGAYVKYRIFSDGVIYGTRYTSGEEVQDFKVIRVSADGTELPSIPMSEYGELQGVSDGKLFLTQSHVTYSETTYESNDLIIAIDLASGEAKAINADCGDSLYYSDGVPQTLIKDGHIYFASFDLTRAALAIYRSDLDGSNRILIAQGYTWAEG